MQFFLQPRGLKMVVISPFCKGFIFVKHDCEVSQSFANNKNARENF